MFWNLVPNTTNWHTLMIVNHGFVMISLKQDLIPDLKMNRTDEIYNLQSICNKTQVAILEAMKIDDNDRT